MYVGDVNSLRLLLDAQANVNTCNNNGESPLYMATAKYHIAAVKMLLVLSLCLSLSLLLYIYNPNISNNPDNPDNPKYHMSAVQMI